MGLFSFISHRLEIGSFWGLIAALLILTIAPPAMAQEAVCAEVRIEIRQKVSLERQAFDAILRIRNGLAGAPVEDVSVEVLFSDLEGHPVVASSDPNNTSATFFIRQDTLDGIGAVDGTGTVAPETTASVRWVIIPSASAGGSTPAGVMYMVGARLQYRLNGEEHDVDVVPETITVRPQPRLALDYFLAGEVYSDDAFTPEIEPPVPFTLGLRLRNTGAGTGHKVSIESAQPQIVENEQGLLIGFRIIGSHVDDQPAAPSLQIDFGDIPAGGTRMGRWLMETTLSGRFVSIDARYTHADVLGGALTSLIDGEPNTHLLVRDVLVDLPGRDGIRDFLARDGDILRVYESNGIDSEVTDRSDSATLSSVSGAQEYALSFPATNGFSYVRIADPTNGAVNGLSVRRPDGRLLPSENAWLSKSRRQDLSWAYYFNVFDANGGGTYAVMVDAAPATASLSGSVYVDANGNGTRDAGEVGLDDVPLLLEGTTTSGNVQRSTFTQDGGTYRFSDLPDGTYAIAVGEVASYSNGSHQAGSAGGVVESTRISQIILGADISADGYVFAKTPVSSTRTADLQVTMLDAQTPVSTGDDTVITIQVRNIGPQATLARTSVSLPEGFTASQAIASSGSFDVATGLWTHGSLLPGQQDSLSLHGSYSALGVQVLGATIQSLDGDSQDPDASNNSMSQEVIVEPPPILTLVLEAAPISDLLLWVSCAVDAAPGCAEDRAQRWSVLLSQAHVPHRVETDTASFVEVLRSGEWPSIWVDGGTDLAQDTISAEIRESLRRGGSVILSGTRHSAWAPIEALAGAVHVADLPDDAYTVDLLENIYFQAGILEVQDSVAAYALAPETTLAQYTSGLAAIVGRRSSASATAMVVGFDPLAAIESVTEPAAFLAHLAHGTAIRHPDVMLGGSRLSLGASARRAGTTEGTLALAVGFPETFTVLGASPLSDSSTTTSLSWVTTWPLPESIFDVRYALRAPEGGGDHLLNAIAQWQAEEDQASMSVKVRSRQEQTDHAATVLDDLLVSSPEDQALKQEASTYMASAQAAYAQGNQTAAITALLAALAALDGISSDDAQDVAIEISRLLLALSREVPELVLELFSDGFESTP